MLRALPPTQPFTSHVPRLPSLEGAMAWDRNEKKLIGDITYHCLVDVIHTGALGPPLPQAALSHLTVCPRRRRRALLGGERRGAVRADAGGLR